MLKRNLPQVNAKGGGASALHFRRLTCYRGRSNGTLHLQVVRQQGQTLKLARHRQKSPQGTGIPQGLRCACALHFRKTIISRDQACVKKWVYQRNFFMYIKLKQITKRSFFFPLSHTCVKIGLNKKENCSNNSLCIAALRWQMVFSTPFFQAFFCGLLVLVIFEQCYDRNHDHNHFVSRHLSTSFSLFNPEKSLIESGVFSIGTTYFLTSRIATTFCALKARFFLCFLATNPELISVDSSTTLANLRFVRFFL